MKDQIKNTWSLALDVMLFYIFAIKLVLILNGGLGLDQDHRSRPRPRPGAPRPRLRPPKSGLERLYDQYLILRLTSVVQTSTVYHGSIENTIGDDHRRLFRRLRFTRILFTSVERFSLLTYTSNHDFARFNKI